MSRLLILGLGVLGEKTLELLLHQCTYFEDIYIASKSASSLETKVNHYKMMGLNFDRSPRIHFKTLDLTNVELTAEYILFVNPDIIFQTAVIQSWWKIRELPDAEFKDISDAGVGPWLPLYLALTYNVMLAVKSAGFKGHVVNACFPDATNAVLSKVGLSPLIGIGNLANSVPLLRTLFSDYLNVSINEIRIHFYAQHFTGFNLPSSADPKKLPKIIRVFENNVDITEQIEIDLVLKGNLSKYTRLRGLAGQGITASSALSVLVGLSRDKSSLVHAPGPLGLEGGYPCLLNNKGIQSIVLKNVNKVDVESIIKKGQSLDGIEKITKEGNVYFNQTNMNILKRKLNYSHDMMNICDVWGYADELLRKYEEFSNKFDKQVVR